MVSRINYPSNAVSASTSFRPEAAAAGFFRTAAAGLGGTTTGGPIGGAAAAVGQALSEVTSSGGGAGNAESLMSGMRMENERLLRLQVGVSQESNKHQAASNVHKADHEARQTTIRNFR